MLVTTYFAENEGELGAFELQTIVQVLLRPLGGQGFVRVFTIEQVRQVQDTMADLLQSGEHIEAFGTREGYEHAWEIEMVYKKNEYLFTYNPDGSIKAIEKQLD